MQGLTMAHMSFVAAESLVPRLATLVDAAVADVTDLYLAPARIDQLALASPLPPARPSGCSPHALSLSKRYDSDGGPACSAGSSKSSTGARSAFGRLW